MRLDLSSERLLETEKCPSCYGTSMCPHIRAGEIQLEGASRWTLVERLFNKKNVFYGRWTARNVSVVLKKLGHDDELQRLDRVVCDLAGQGSGCDSGDAMKQVAERLTVPAKRELKGLENGRLILETLDLGKLKSVASLAASDSLQCTPHQDKVDHIVSQCLHHPSSTHIHHILSKYIDYYVLLFRVCNYIPYYPQV